MEAYSLVQQAGETLLNQKISGENTYNIISPLLEKAVALDSTYADALAYLAIAKITRYEDEEAADYVEKEIKAFGEAAILVEKALLFETDHELSLGLSIIMPLIQMQIDKSENYDLFMMRKLAIQLDGYISKFPDSLTTRRWLEPLLK